MDTAKILVVDDDPGVQFLVEETLGECGYQVVPVSDGETALELIQDTEFDLALIDLKLAAVEGLEVLNTLRRCKPDTAAIILTGHGSLESAIMALREGASDYLLKPWTPEQLRASVRAGLDERRRILRQRESARMVSEVTHQLRGPITSIGLNLELLEHETTERQVRYLESLKQATAQIQSLVEGTLTLTRLEREDRRPFFSSVNLNLIALQIAAVYQAQAQKAGVALTLELASDLPRVWAAQEVLTQAVANLVSNALHYTPQGQVILRTYVADDQACLEVQDTGVGIPPEELPHLFERFHRGRIAMHLDTQGSGLGLAIVKEIVALHRGEVYVTSEVGVGSVFQVKLPLAPGMPSATPAPAA
jgi:signal transduction histidine kinase